MKNECTPFEALLCLRVLSPGLWDGSSVLLTNGESTALVSRELFFSTWMRSHFVFGFHGR